MIKRTARDTSLSKPASPTIVAVPRSTVTALLDPIVESVTDTPTVVEMVQKQPTPATTTRRARPVQAPAGKNRFAAQLFDEHATNRQAELFYLQKQIQLQTQMVFVLEDGARIQGVVEWYDRQSIKVRGKSRLLIYKSAIKYLYKAGEIGTAPEA
jgi:sRNA-binding regulator protein Hfq